MFEDFEEELKKKTPKKELVEIDLGDNVLFNPDLLESKLKCLDSIPDGELFELLKDSYNTLLSNIFFGDTRFLTYFTNSKFLSVFIQVIRSVNLSQTNKIYCNKIAYDYITSDNPDPYIKTLLYSLSKTVNRDILPGLLGLGINEDLASYMALARYSSQNESVNVKRLNFIIVSSPMQLMTEQNIVWIYEKLFDRFTPLFEGTMFDVCDTGVYTEEMENIYSTISLAVLDILDSMPSLSIRKVLISYTGDYQSLYYKPNQRTTRFSMLSLSPDYDRINKVVESLKQENIYVP